MGFIRLMRLIFIHSHLQKPNGLITSNRSQTELLTINLINLINLINHQPINPYPPFLPGKKKPEFSTQEKSGNKVLVARARLELATLRL